MNGERFAVVFGIANHANNLGWDRDRIKVVVNALIAAMKP